MDGFQHSEAAEKVRPLLPTDGTARLPQLTCPYAELPPHRRPLARTLERPEGRFDLISSENWNRQASRFSNFVRSVELPI